jgi:phosphotransferase system  glucose/maltose/N-acetylglucosamine-specific IIC component
MMLETKQEAKKMNSTILSILVSYMYVHLSCQVQCWYTVAYIKIFLCEQLIHVVYTLWNYFYLKETTNNNEEGKENKEKESEKPETVSFY